jgi:phosphate starvation-inducible PhoH-like protein
MENLPNTPTNHENGYTGKRKIKGEIKFLIPLNDEQKEAKRIILENDITVLKGMAGSGKTLVGAQVALDMLFRKEIERIIICRPAISKEEIGFLPGTASDKLGPYLQPVMDNFYRLYNKDKIDELVKEGKITIVPFAFMRGHTFSNSMIIADEAQNISFSFLELLIGRLGLGSKMVICGDSSQIDLKDRKESSFNYLNILEKEVEGFKVFTLKKNHRHPIVEKLLEVIKELKQ